MKTKAFKTYHVSAKLLILLMSMAIFLGCRPDKEPIGIGGLIEVLKKREIHLIQYNYHDMIFLHKKDNPDKKVIMAAKYPVSIAAAVDLTNITINESESQKTVTLSAPEIQEPIVKVSEAEFISVRDGFRLFVPKNSRLKLMESLQKGIKESKRRLSQNALDLGILEQAENEARSFINDFIPSFTGQDSTAYNVVFTSGENALELIAPDEGEKPLINILEVEVTDELEEAINN